MADLSTPYTLATNDQNVAQLFTRDDLVGDTSGDDDLDNEVIQIDLTKIDPSIEQVALF